ncbi:MAG: PDZ domain-containing protein [Phycisphaerales bacterium]|nr:PDZ domain-containing protein [Phycisphaerales bacterium]
MRRLPRLRLSFGRSTVLGAIVCSLAMLTPATRAQANTPELSSAVREQAEHLREEMRQMVLLARDHVFPALVNIRVTTVNYWGGKQIKGRSVGSGTIITPEGHILTNYHVVDRGQKFVCVLADKQEIEATLVGEDPLTDLAVLKLDFDKYKGNPFELPVAHFGDSSEVEIGDTVMAMGSPLALSRSVTLGIVSNVERMLAGSDDTAGEMDISGERTGIFNRWIQHDAAINPGNSGGPLVNLRGEIIGINTRGNNAGGGDMGFAIPSNIARDVAEKLIKFGEAPRSYYGFSLKAIKNTGLDRGVLVDGLITEAPASAAGIRAGDVIVAIDGEPITVEYAEQIPPLLKSLADRPIGAAVVFDIERDGEKLTITVETEKQERDRGDEAAFPAWGITAGRITKQMAHQWQLPGGIEGAFVSSVRRGSPAQIAEPPLEPGHVIRAIDGKPINTLADLVAEYDRVMEADDLPEYLLVEFDQGRERQLTLLKPKPDKDRDPPRELPKAWIGVATQPVFPKLAKRMGDADKLGFRVTRVYPGTTAAVAGLQVGDLITAMDDTEFRPSRIEDSGVFQRAVRKLDYGDAVKLHVWRGDKQLEIPVELERTRVAPAEAHIDRNPWFELTVREMTFFDQDRNDWDENVRGVIVLGVESAGWAANAGLTPGDLIERINDDEIDDLNGYRQVMDRIFAEQPERVVFVVRRGVASTYLFAQPDWRPNKDVSEAPDSADSGAPE